MITEEEKREIINQAKEEILLAMPEVIGNLMLNHVAMTRINKKFYEAYPEFATHKDVVQSVVEMVEGENPHKEYEDILKSAVPEIKRRLVTMKNLTFDAPAKMQRDFSKVPSDSNGEL